MIFDDVVPIIDERLIDALRQLIVGANIADVVPIFGSINMIGGECDR